MSTIYCFGDFSFEQDTLRLTRGVNHVTATNRQLQTLSVLLKANGCIVSRERLFDEVWEGVAVEDHNLTQTVFMLRRILGKKPDGEEYIVTVPKRGYRFSQIVAPDADLIAQKLPAASAMEIVGRLKNFASDTAREQTGIWAKVSQSFKRALTRDLTRAS